MYSGFFNMPQICDMGSIILLPFEGRRAEDFYRPLKIQRLRPGLNPRTWVLGASTLPLHHIYWINIQLKCRVTYGAYTGVPFIVSLVVTTDKNISVDAGFLSDKGTVSWGIRKGLAVVTLTTNYKIKILQNIIYLECSVKFRTLRI
jgi:hypothetical protein